MFINFNKKELGITTENAIGFDLVKGWIAFFIFENI